MPTATKNPADILARLRRLPSLPPSSPQDLARLRVVAAENIEPVPDADSPDVGTDAPGLIQINPALEISPRNAAWFARHGGTRALNRALRAWIATQGAPSRPVRSARVRRTV